MPIYSKCFVYRDRQTLGERRDEAFRKCIIYIWKGACWLFERGGERDFCVPRAIFNFKTRKSARVMTSASSENTRERANFIAIFFHGFAGIKMKNS